MTSDSTNALITIANTWVHDKTGQPLSPIQVEILTQVLTGKRVKEVQITGYTPKTVQRKFTPELWRLLTDALGQSVRARTVHRILEQISQHEGKPTEQDMPSLRHKVSQNISHSLSPGICPSSILHNLPAPTYTEFIGREEELKKLLDHLSFDRSAHIISIDGTGGVGKTSLAMEAAYCCLRGTFRNGDRLTGIAFDAIIFVTSKETYLTPIGLVRNYSPRRGLQDIFRQIALVLELDLTGLEFEDQIDTVKQALSKRLCWLIIDNLESLDSEQQEQILAFLFELPSTVKTVITTRNQIVFVPVRLFSMDEDDSLKLIEHEAQEKGVTLSHHDKRELHRVTGGVPIAIGFAVGMLANGALLDEVFDQLTQPKGEIARFCFESSVRSLKGTTANQMLMAFALFPASVSRDALMAIAVADPNSDSDSDRNNNGDVLSTAWKDVLRDPIAQLRGFSLIQSTENGRYQMLPLMREYAMSLLKSSPDDEHTLRNRWIHFYIKDSGRYQANTIEAEITLEQVDLNAMAEWPDEWTNLEAVVAQCMAEDRYDALVTLHHNTQHFISLIGRKATRIGYWGDRLSLLQWLTQAADQRGDFSTLAQALFDYAWMLTQLGKPQQLKEAEQCFSRVTELKDYLTPYQQQDLAVRHSILRLRQGHRQQAVSEFHHLHQTTLVHADLLEPERQKLLTLIHYYLGRSHFDNHQFDDAKIQFELSLQAAETLHWKRSIMACRNWLNKLAIKQENSSTAESNLQADLAAARREGDSVRVALCLRSLAQIAQRQQNSEQAKKLLLEAQKIFRDLGMDIETNAIDVLLSTQKNG